MSLPSNISGVCKGTPLTSLPSNISGVCKGTPLTSLFTPLPILPKKDEVLASWYDRDSRVDLIRVKSGSKWERRMFISF